MTSQKSVRPYPRWLVVLFAGVCFGLPIPAARAEITLRESSIRYVPEDAAFYLSFMRNKQQYDAVVNSNALARLMEMPFVQEMRTEAEQQLEAVPPEAAQAKDFFESPEGQELKEVLLELLSDEVFIYGGQGYAKLFELQRAAFDFGWEAALKDIRAQEQLKREAALDAVLEDEVEQDVDEDAEEQSDEELDFDIEDELFDDSGDEGGDDEEINRLMLRFLDENIDDYEIPVTVIGFKLRDHRRVEKQLERAQTLIEAALETEPKLLAALSRKQIAGAEFLVATFDKTTIPWEEIPLEQSIKPLEEVPGEFDGLIAKIKDFSLTVAVGIRDQHLLVFVGPSEEHLVNLEKVPLLAHRKEFQPLRRHADQRIASIAYVSHELAHAIGSGKKQIDNWMALFDMALEESELPPDVQTRAREDLAEFGADIKSFIPEPGAWLRFSMLTNRGYETFSHSWMENRTLDGSQRLTILDHVGGNPIWVVASRKKYSLRGYRTFTKWVGKIQRYFEEFGLQEMDEEQREQYQLGKDLAAPFWERLDKATAEMLWPAFQDGQRAFVLDSKLTSNQWYAALPPSAEPLPMLEPALVLGVSDATLLKQACAEYVAIVEDAVAKARELAPDGVEIPDAFKIPPPQTRTFPNEGDFYFYQGAAAVGVEQQVVPTAGLSDEFLALAISAKHARRLLNRSPLSVGGPLQDVDRPLAAASHFNWARLLDTLDPWLDYAVEMAADSAATAASAVEDFDELSDEDESEPGADEFEFDEFPEEPAGGPDAEEVEMIVQQTRDMLSILKCFRSFTRATYIEGDAVVRHSEWHIQDLAD